MDMQYLDHIWVCAWAAGQRLVMDMTLTARRAAEDAGYAVEPTPDGRLAVSWSQIVPWSVRATIQR